MSIWNLILPTFLLALPQIAEAELVGFIPSDYGTLYLISETGSNCPNDLSAVFVQESGTNQDGSFRVHKMPGCWERAANGDVVVTWPGLGKTSHMASQLRKLEESKAN